MTKLEHLTDYFLINRQIGHTTAMLDGAKKTKAIVIVATFNHARQMVREHGVKAISIDEIPDSLYGLNAPVVIDHYALSLLIHEHTKEILKRSKELIES